MNKTGSRTMLPRVADLERSVQWTSLASDIDDLERRRVDDRPVIRTIERHAYQRGSMPEVQRVCTVRFRDDDRDALSQRDPDNSYLRESENSRWSWKPRTDFEREYFYKDYKDYYCGDSGARFEPAVYEISPGDRSHPREKEEEEARRSYGSPTVPRSSSSSTRHPAGLEKEHFSDSRDRLHEIFAHNRYLRRQFFASSGNSRRDCNGSQGSRNLGRSNRSEASRRCTGFGSTETLASQSNQSSMSSINDRKSRTQTTRTPEEEEEEYDALVEFARRNNVVPRRKLNGDVQRDGKVLVNILPGSEIRRVDVKNVPNVNLGVANNEHVASPSVKVARNRSTRDNRGTLDNLAAWIRKRNLPEYIFGGDPRIESRRDGTSLPSRCDGNGYHQFTRDDSERNGWNRLSRNEISVDRVSASVAFRNDGGIRKDLCKSLPNLTVQRRNLEAPLYVARTVNVPESDDYDIDSHIARSGHGSGKCRGQRSGRRCEGRARSISRGQSISDATTVSPIERLTPRSKMTRVPPPPPLDLSMVNEQCERIEAAERRYLNDYRVDVAILRSHEEDLAKDQLTEKSAEKERRDRIENGDPPRNRQSRGREDDGRRSSCLRKSADALGSSPQLVDDRKSFASDSRMTVDSVGTHRRPIDPDASPLFDQTSPIGGLHAAGSTLPSTVYGPIPYSQ
ncbi:sorbin and sh3 domain-containing protein 1 [Lasius niger]|uniref:Sorbin and sh3 domain-containing protein 1 n=1 Tax=Lasius niger TaxID=67767 RepID=A0A0J7NT92_LASNI|nr:sorbin and sh3 domain-containing protein 1 [Lasius niger]